MLIGRSAADAATARRPPGTAAECSRPRVERVNRTASREPPRGPFDDARARRPLHHHQAAVDGEDLAGDEGGLVGGEEGDGGWRSPRSCRSGRAASRP